MFNCWRRRTCCRRVTRLTLSSSSCAFFSYLSLHTHTDTDIPVKCSKATLLCSPHPSPSSCYHSPAFFYMASLAFGECCIDCSHVKPIPH
jgi:hypothetical protein